MDSARNEHPDRGLAGAKPPVDWPWVIILIALPILFMLALTVIIAGAMK